MKKVVLFVTIVIVALSSCNFGNSGFKKAKSGNLYKIIAGKGGDSIKVGDIVQYTLVQKFGDSVGYSSYEAGNMFARIDFEDQKFNESEIMKKMRIGDSASMRISVDSIYAFLKSQRSNIPGFVEADFKKQVLPFFLKRGKYVSVNFRPIKKYANDSLARIDYMKEQPKQQAYQEKLQKKQMEEMRKKAEENKKAGAKFVEGVLAKDNSIQKTASGIAYKIITAGSGEKPTMESQVRVQYVGNTIDGREFDNSYKRKEPTIFGVGQVVKGWQEVLQMMPVGSKYKVWIPGDLGYGDQGNPQGGIEPGATLIFEMELMEIVKDKANPAVPNMPK
jgi:FKBP-type peptidyl-prolyl cis-trans isomerase